MREGEREGGERRVHDPINYYPGSGENKGLKLISAVTLNDIEFGM